MKQWLWRYGKILLLGSFFVAVSLTLALTPSATIIELIGSENAFLFMFLLGLVGGISTFVGIPYHFVLMSLAAGGINPLFLGIATALGVMCGDSTMYVLGRSIRGTLSPRLSATLHKVSGYLEEHPRLVTPGLFAYGALSPFSNDFVVATMSMSGHSYMRTILPLALGNCVFNVGVAYLGFYAYSSFSSWF